MEDELKCSYCRNFYCNPVLLPCCHSLCFACALQLQEKFNETKVDLSNPFANAAKSATTILLSSSSSNQTPQSHSPHSISSSSSANIDQMCRTLSATDLGSSIVSDLDKLSVFSEADSGVSSSANTSASRPCSFIGGQQSSPDYIKNYKNSMHSLSLSSPLPPAPVFAASPLYSTFLPCPQCKRMIYMDETGVNSLTKNTCLENIVERYCESKKLSLKCQMCPPGEAERDALFMCEQCEVYYCDQCRELCHPMRGPLAKHSLVAPKFGRELVRQKNRSRESKCSDHSSENVTLYCLLCKCACCHLCVTESVHINHQTQPINLFCKSQKVNATLF